VEHEDQPADELLAEATSVAPGRDDKLKQVERIIASATFENALRLQKFLRYVAVKAIEGLEDEVKEYTVGVHVFRKGAEFDPRTDTQVRTEASRLRLRLERYYASEGAADDLLVAIPKGHYVPQFSRRLTPVPGESAGRSGAPPATNIEHIGGGVVEPPPRRHSRLWGAGLIVLAVAAAFWTGRYLAPPLSQSASRGANASPDDVVVSRLWSGLVEAGNPPLVAFSNPAFLADQRGQLMQYRESGTLPAGTTIPDSRAQMSGATPGSGPLVFWDSMTGTGEVSAVASLDRVFWHLGSPVEVKRGRLVTVDDLHRRNVVFAGSPEVNGVLENLRLPREFEFVAGTATENLWGERIINLHPQPGEKKEYVVQRDPATGAVLVEYGVVSFLPGIAPRRTIVMLAGILGGGTEAAAAFATSTTGVRELVEHLGRTDSKSGKRLPPFFEALIRVEYARGMILGIHYVSGRIIQPQRPAFLVGASGPNSDDELK
jgi:hypothetical protein